MHEIRFTDPNRMHYLLSIYLTINLYMCREGLLLTILKYYSAYAFTLADC